MYENKSLLAIIIRLVVLPALILGAGVGGMIVLGRLREPPESNDRQREVPKVATVAVEAYDGTLDIEVDGVVVPYREISLSAEVDGRIETKTDACRAGRYVRAGTLLLQIDRSDHQREVARLNADKKQAEDSLAELRAELENTAALIKLAESQQELVAKELRRQESLYQDNINTEADVDLAKQNLLQADNGLLTLQGKLAMAKAREGRLKWAVDRVDIMLEQAQADLDRTTIVSPVDGVVVEDLVEQDSYVRTGTALVTVEDTSKVEVKCSLRMDELYWLWDQRCGPHAAAPFSQDTAAVDAAEELVAAHYEAPPTAVTVVYQLGNTKYKWDGVLSRFDGIGLDTTTRTVPCRVVVDDPLGVEVVESSNATPCATGPPALVRGMFVTLHVQAKPRTVLLRAPEKAIRPGGQVWQVKKGRLWVRDVDVVRLVTDADGQRVAYIRGDTSELSSGDRVATSPLAIVPESAYGEQGLAVREERRK